MLLKNINKVLILEDYKPSRTLFLEILQFVFKSIEIVESESIAHVSQLVEQNVFDLAIIDINLPDGSGIDVISRLRNISPETYCIVATVSEDDKTFFAALRAGTHGYLLKSDSRNDLISHLKGILYNQPPLSKKMAQKMIGHFKRAESSAVQSALKLTDRELQIVELIAEGLPRKSIARNLALSIHTINDHVKTIYKKLNVSSSIAATRAAIEHGLITTPEND